MRRRFVQIDGELVEVSRDYVQLSPDAPMVFGDLPGYFSQSGIWVEGKRARREDLKRSGCRPWEGLDQEKKEAARRQAYADQQLDRGLEKTAGEVYAQFRVTHRI